jgi:F-type H+-transporting ATPase subunit delta
VIQTAIARRYAKALFTLLPSADVQQAAQALEDLAGAIAESGDLRALLKGPHFSREQRSAVMRRLMQKAGASSMVERFVLHLIQKHRIDLLPEISAAFAKMVEQASHRMAVTVASPRALSPEAQANLKGRLQQATSWAIDLRTTVDPSLVGGLKIWIGSTVYDGSVHGQLERLRSALIKSA